MFEIRKTAIYAQWLDGLRDIHARARVLARVERLAAGNAGVQNRLVGESRNCESITDPATASITQCAGAR